VQNTNKFVQNATYIDGSPLHYFLLMEYGYPISGR
jgi:hypothetical protein